MKRKSNNRRRVPRRRTYYRVVLLSHRQRLWRFDGFWGTPGAFVLGGVG